MNKLVLPLITLLTVSAYTAYVMLRAEQSPLQLGPHLGGLQRPHTGEIADLPAAILCPDRAVCAGWPAALSGAQGDRQSSATQQPRKTGAAQRLYT
jgi:hypothetical protein